MFSKELATYPSLMMCKRFYSSLMLSGQDDTLVPPIYKRTGFMDYKNPMNPLKKKIVNLFS
jgi:hypothetical protein